MRPRPSVQDFGARFAREVSNETGKAFFDAWARFLAQELDADSVFLADTARRAPGHAKLVSAFPEISDHQDLERELDVSPRLQSAGLEPCVSDLENLPVAWLSHLPVGSRVRHCLSIPLLDQAARPAGLVAIAYESLPQDVETPRILVDIAAPRAVRELERLWTERLLAGEKRILELLAHNVSLEQILTALARLVEEQAGGMLCSIFVLDRAGVHLRCGAAPTFPEALGPGADGITIGPDSSACGRSVYLKQPVTCPDISSDPIWSDSREAALLHGLRASWCTPICDGNGNAVGAFACYFREAREPQEHELRLIARLAHVAQVSIELHRVQEDRWESEKKLRLIGDNSTEVIMAYDMERRLIYVNPAIEKQTGYSIHEMWEKHFINWVHPDDNATMMALWERLFQGEGYSGREFRIVTKEGETKWILGSWHPLRDERGCQIGVQGREIDITERKLLEEQLRQSHKMEAIGRLAGGVAHDFNNLLTAIIGHSELLLQQVEDTNPLRLEVEEIKKAGERAALLTRQLLAFSRKQVLTPVTLNLNDLLDNMGKMLRRLIREDIRLVTLGRSGLWLVKADPGQMEQVILNLALNARDAMPNGGSLTIRVSNATLDAAQVRSRLPMKPGQYTKLTVTDTGMGMDEATRARIFEPFSTTKELGKGTGLGLSTVYGIVKQSGGFIWVDSRPGKGTTFEIFMPRVEESAEVPKDETLPSPQPPAGTRTILVVEDDDSVRRPIRRMLETKGYQVLEARNPEEALKTARQEHSRIDLVLTDMVMPRMSGREMALRLAEMHRSIRILYMSGHIEDPDMVDDALKDGGDFIEKPFCGSTLTNKVREILGRASP